MPGFLIVLALALGKLTQALGTGPFVAQLLQSSPPVAVIPALVFLLGAVSVLRHRHILWHVLHH